MQGPAPPQARKGGSADAASPSPNHTGSFGPFRNFGNLKIEEVEVLGLSVWCRNRGSVTRAATWNPSDWDPTNGHLVLMQPPGD